MRMSGKSRNTQCLATRSRRAHVATHSSALLTNRRAQYTLITFVIAAVILLSLSGIVIDLVNQKADEIAKTQILLELGDRIRMLSMIQKEERQVGVDFTGIHLGILGGWPAGVSKCGSSRNDTASWLLKSVPYWYSGSETAQFYNYTGAIYANRGFYANDPYMAFKFENIRNGLYNLNTDSGWAAYYIIDGELSNDNPIYLDSGAHTFTFAKYVCSHVRSGVSCSIPAITTSLPSTLVLSRNIPPGSEYETCIPDSEFIKSLYTLFLNKYFKTMSDLALVQIKDITSLSTINLRFFDTLINYEADVESMGENTVFITFYPLNIPLIDMRYNGIANATYQGSSIVFDAFDSNFAGFQGIATEIINDNILNGLINSIIEKHSHVDFNAKLPVKGSIFSAYEKIINDSNDPSLANWTVTQDTSSRVSFDNFFPVDEVKSYCLYYLKEACQFLSDEVVNGLRAEDYVKGSTALYDNFTKEYMDTFANPTMKTNWANALTICQKCHDSGKYNNPCTNLSNSDCIACFNLASGYDYSADYEEEFRINNTISEGGPSCEELVNRDLVHLINKYLIYRFSDFQQLLKNKYFGFDWKLDSERINVTKITYSNMDSGVGFNSSCGDCITARPEECEFINSDLAIENAKISVFRDYIDELGSPGVYETEPTGIKTIIENDVPKALKWDSSFVSVDDARKNITLRFTVTNKGNTKERVYLTVLVDAFDNLIGNQNSDYYKIPDRQGVTLILPNEAIVSETRTPGLETKLTFDQGDLDFDNRFDFFSYNGTTSFQNYYLGDVKSPIYVGSDASLISTSISPYIDTLIIPENYSLGTKAHMLRACVHSGNNDDFNTSNNCAEFRFGVCTEGDLSRTCCESSITGGSWIDVGAITYGACCGDDSPKPGVCSSLLYDWHIDAFGDSKTLDAIKSQPLNLINPSSVSGYYGRAISIDSSKYAFTSGLSGLSNQLTIAFWIYKTGTWDGGQLILEAGAKGTGDTTDSLISISVENPFIKLCPGGVCVQVSAPSNIQIDNWHHVTGTYDGSIARLYIDGKIINSVKSSISVSSINALKVFASNLNSPAQGTVDEIQIYKRALTPEEIKLISKVSPYACNRQKVSGILNMTINETCSNLISEWRFDEAIGSTTNDFMGLNNGTLVNSPVFSADAIFNNSIRFTTTGDKQVKINSPSLLSKEGSMSVCMWFKTTSSTFTYYNFDSGTTDYLAGRLQRVSGGGLAYTYGARKFTPTFYGSTYGYQTVTSSPVTTGAWTHACIVRRLPEDYICTKGLVGEWRFDEASGNYAEDATLNNRGALSSAKPSIVPGVVGNALSFTSNYVRIESNSDNNFNALKLTGSMTLCMWLKPAGDFSTRRNPISKSYGGEFTLTQEIGGRLSFYYGQCGSDCEPYQGISTTNALTLNAWNHVCIVRDLSRMKALWYINGVLDSETSLKYYYAVGGTRPINIGTGYAGNYNGAIDEVKIYNRVLSAQDIGLLYKVPDYCRGKISWYINGVLDTEVSASFVKSIGSSGALRIGGGDGRIDDMRVYDRDLSPEEVKNLYSNINIGCSSDDAFIDSNKLCYYGTPYSCPDDAPIAARIRNSTNARIYDAPLTNYFCTGV